MQFENIFYISISDTPLFINNLILTFFSFVLNLYSSIKSILFPSILILNFSLLFLTNVLLNNLVLNEILLLYSIIIDSLFLIILLSFFVISFSIIDLSSILKKYNKFFILKTCEILDNFYNHLL